MSMYQDRYKQLKNQAAAEVRREMREAIKRLWKEEPERYAVLLKRAQDANYNRKCVLEAQAKEARQYAEAVRLAALEKARRLIMPVVAALPDIDMSKVHGMVAFRVWGQDERGLRSTAMDFHWREVNFADRKPACHNQHGFYCVKLTGLGVMTAGAQYFGTGRQNVSGFVELLGHVVEHTDGILRAEVARLICLFVTSDNSNIGVVVRVLHELYPTTPVFVLNPEQLADVVMREVLRLKYSGGRNEEG